MKEQAKKIAKSYSLDPDVVAWVTQRAARLTIEGLNGERANDSKVVNDILTAAMEEDKHVQQIIKPKVQTKIKQAARS